MKRTQTAPSDQKIDIDRIDAFLKEGSEAVADLDVDPLSAMKAKPRLAQRKPQVAENPVHGQPAPEVARPPIPPGALKISVSEDRMQAYLAVRPARVRHLMFKDVMEVLQRAKIKEGVEEDAIMELVDGVATSEEAELALLVAKGTLPVPGTDAECTIPALSAPEGLALIVPAGCRLLTLRSSGQVRDVDKGCAGLPLLQAGEVAVQIRPAVPGREGRDVFGQNVPVAPVREDVPVHGSGLEMSKEGTAYVAQQFGYLVCDEEAFSIVSPIAISSDELSAYVLALSPPNRALEASPLCRIMRDMGIARIPAEAVFAKHLAQYGNRCGALLVARGKAPENGRDGQIKLAVDTASHAGRMLEDGSIDFKERNFAASVEPGALIAEKWPAVPGIPGQNVYGKELPAPPVQEAGLEAGPGVEMVKEDGRYCFKAQIEGCVYHLKGALEVRQEVRIAGNVDYATGNLDVPGDLWVMGNVCGGFSAKAKGNIAIGGGVESGAQVMASGSVTVGGGIFGERTRVVALGKIQSKFVQDASLLGRGDIEIGCYIYNASVRSGSCVIIHGLGDRGGIVGGEVCAKTRIRSTSVGSEFGTPTRLLTGVDVELSRSLQKVDQGLNFCRTNMRALMSALKISTPDSKAIGQAMANVPGSQRKEMIALARKLEELTPMEKKLDAERRELMKKQIELAKVAEIYVGGTIFHKVDLFFGRTTRRIDDPIQNVGFRLSKNMDIESFAPTEEKAEN